MNFVFLLWTLLDWLVIFRQVNIVFFFSDFSKILFFDNHIFKFEFLFLQNRLFIPLFLWRFLALYFRLLDIKIDVLFLRLANKGTLSLLFTVMALITFCNEFHWLWTLVLLNIHLVLNILLTNILDDNLDIIIFLLLLSFNIQNLFHGCLIFSPRTYLSTLWICALFWSSKFVWPFGDFALLLLLFTLAFLACFLCLREWHRFINFINCNVNINVSSICLIILFLFLFNS